MDENNKKANLQSCETVVKEYHPYVYLFPPMSAEEKETLRKDIEKNGILNPIIIHEGKIVDGRHRYEIALSLGMAENDIPMIILDPSDDPLDYVLSSNFHRRHLNTSQRAIIAANLAAGGYGMTAKERASQMNISEPLVRQADKVLKHGSRGVIAAIESGDIAVSDANKIADLSKGEQNEALEAVRSVKGISNLKKAVQHIKRKERENVAAANALKYKNSPDCKIYQCSVKDLVNKIPENSVDVILTDPPYPADFLYCWDELGELAMRILKQGGSLVAMSGQSHFSDVSSRLLKSGLSEYWVICYNMPGVANQVSYRAISNHWKPVIWMTKGKTKPKKWVADMVTVPKLSRQENELHEWQQQKDGWQMLTDTVVSSGDIVCDPFLGSGTSAVCAIDAGCLFIGSDISKECVNISKERVKEHVRQISI